MNLKITTPEQNILEISFGPRLDIDAVSNLWSECLEAVDKQNLPLLQLDFTNVEYCDGSGIALIRTLQKRQESNGGKINIKNLRSNLKELLDYIEKQPDRVNKRDIEKSNLPIQLGYAALNVLRTIRENIAFLGSLSIQMFLAILHFKKNRWKDFLRIAEDTGPQAVSIIALIGFLIGLISTFQAAPTFADFGAQIYMVDLVGLGLVREIGPLLTAVLLAGRTASAFAAEIGTMKVNQEIDALKTMGLSPIRFLVVPRIFAVMLVTPILEAFFIIFGLLGCLAVMLTLGYTVDAFMHRIYEAILPVDYLGGLVKTFVFGMVIGGVGCLHGIKTRFGAQAVGYSTTQAVVSSLIMLVIVDGIFAVIYYVLGI